MKPTVDIDELIVRPLNTIELLRAELKAGGDNDAEDTSGAAGLAGAVSALLLTGDSPALSKIPVLSRKALDEGKLPPNSLVRYRGMIQDQYEPEYFVGSFEQVETATGQRSRVDVKYADAITQKPGFVNEFDGPGAKTLDRLPLFCVPVPGLSPWAHPLGEDGGLAKMTQQDQTQGLPKRRREEATLDEMDCASGNDDAAPDGQLNNGHRKNPRAPNTANLAKQDEENNNAEALGDGAASAFEHRQELELDGLACIVKMYDFHEGLLKLNDTVEFVGVLAYDQPDRSQEEEGQEEMATPEPVERALRAGAATAAGVSDPFKAMEDFARKVPPPSLAPRLHCIFHRMIPACAPLDVDPKESKSALYALQGPLPFGTLMLDTKQQAIEHLAKALGGDLLAAEFTLLTLLSRPYVRTESLAPGSLSLNLRGMSVENAADFHSAVAELVPKCARVSVTTESLKEKFKFAPKKNYEADRLMLSNLQLSEGTVVVLDETELEPGQIGAEGVANLTALNSLLSLQKVPYDFGFYKMDFEVDHPSISVSLGRSVVPTSASFPVVPSSGRRRGSAGWDADETVREVVDAGMLARVRLYIEATRRMELSLDEESSKMAEEDFVQTRQQGREVTGEDFHRWLTLARLTALSLGDSTVSASHWSHMKDLEARVAARIEGVKAASTTDTSDNGSGVARATISPTKAALLNVIPES